MGLDQQRWGFISKLPRWSWPSNHAHFTYRNRTPQKKGRLTITWSKRLWRANIRVEYFNCNISYTWRIIPLNKWLVILRRLTITRITSRGMILQVWVDRISHQEWPMARRIHWTKQKKWLLISPPKKKQSSTTFRPWGVQNERGKSHQTEWYLCCEWHFSWPILAVPEWLYIYLYTCIYVM